MPRIETLVTSSMEKADHTPELQSLFAYSTPQQAWDNAATIIRRINPAYDFSRLYMVFSDVALLFNGSYPGYDTIKTPYHDLQHTLDVFLCTARLMHGVHLGGDELDDDAITLLCIAALLHDIGYAQRQSEASGTGAQFTQTHIERGIEFARHYFAEHGLPETWPKMLASIIYCTSLELQFSKIDFPDSSTRLLGQILGSADLVGQMADRTYLEKLLFLYLEFEEAKIGNYRSMYDLLCRTRDFYEYTLVKLNEDFGGIYTRLALHFKDCLGVEKNYYVESISKNLAYLSQVISLDEDSYQGMLRRNGIVEMVKTIHH